jgi:hypothetical protein
MRRLPTLLVVAGVLALASCGTSPVPAASADPAPPEASPLEVAEVAANPALPASWARVGGGEIEFTALAGQPVALWFWAPT